MLNQNNMAFVLPQIMRDKLRLDPNIGAGNFIQYACRVNPYADLPLIFLDTPLKLASKEELSCLSLNQFNAIAENFAAFYINKDIKAKDVVAVYITDSIQYLIQYVALTSIGAIPALINGLMDIKIAAAFIKKIGAVSVYSDKSRNREFKKILESENIMLLTEPNTIKNEVKLPDGFPYVHDELDPIMITHTSGTTGIPKAVLLQHSKFFYGIRYLLSLPLMQGMESVLSALPCSHNSAIAYAMYALLSGVTLTISAKHNGEQVVRLIEKYKPTTVVAFPQTYVELAELDLEKHDLNSVSYWINSGDAAHEAHIKKLVQHGNHYRGSEKIQGSQFVDGLGSSEMGHTLFRVVHTPYTNNYDRCIGFPQKWIDVAVLDESGNDLPPFKIGKLGIKGPSITSGYWNDSALTHRSILSGYWLTGDLVYKDEKGCFYHVDRINDAIKTENGFFYTVQTEELLLKNSDRIADCAVIGVSGNDTYQYPVAYVRLKVNTKANNNDLLIHFNQVLQNNNYPLLKAVVICNKSDIPVGITGKVLKRVLRENYIR